MGQIFEQIEWALIVTIIIASTAAGLTVATIASIRVNKILKKYLDKYFQRLRLRTKANEMILRKE